MIAGQRRTLEHKRDGWPVERSRGGVFGLAVAAVLLLLGVGLLLLAVRQPPGWAGLAAFGLATLAGGGAAGMVVAALGYFRLSYEFLPGRLVIRSAGPPESILLDDVDGVYSGQRIGDLRQVRGLSWPGYYLGAVRTRTTGVLSVYCTRRDVQSLTVITTPTRTLVLSPRDPAGFRRELVRRIEAAERAVPAPPETRTRWLALPGPISAGVLAGTLVLWLAGLLALANGFELLPEQILLFVDPNGRGGAASPRGQAYLLPALGLVVLVVNLGAGLLLRRREPAAAALLFATAALAQLAVLLAVLRLLP